MKPKTCIVRTEIDRAKLIADIRRAPLTIEGKTLPLVCRMSRLTRKRSLSQNRLLWAWNTILGLHVGCEPEEMHHDLCAEINGTRERINPITGEITQAVIGTSGMNTTEMQDYLDRVGRLAAEHFGVALPSPDDLGAWDAVETLRPDAERHANVVPFRRAA